MIRGLIDFVATEDGKMVFSLTTVLVAPLLLTSTCYAPRHGEPRFNLEAVSRGSKTPRGPEFGHYYSLRVDTNLFDVAYCCDQEGKLLIHKAPSFDAGALGPTQLAPEQVEETLTL